MKKSIILFTIFLSSFAFAKTPLDTKNLPTTVTIDYFLEACTVVGETEYGMIHNFDCETYIYGVLDTLAVTKSNLKNPLVCLPKNIAPWQVYEIISAYPIKQARNSAATPLIIQVLSTKYPCHKAAQRKTE